jgi:uncharacterized protein (TIGR02646 family)
MRPVERGMSPQAFSNYRDAYPYLVERMGDYCSYCERQIETHLAVEHVQPKDPVPALVNSWTNFLLGCVHCNSCKGATQVSVMDYLWPDTDNTLRAFEYGPGGSISSNPTLVPAIRAKADAMITRRIDVPLNPTSVGSSEKKLGTRPHVAETFWPYRTPPRHENSSLMWRRVKACLQYTGFNSLMMPT